MSTPTTPADAILEFSRGQPLWLQDALRRICQKRVLEIEDYVDLLALLKATGGGSVAAPEIQAQPLAPEHLPQRPAKAARTLLASIADISNANRLAASQTLTFAVDGVTLIYGENGSGKSGYCRVLKKLCRVREGADEQLLGDAFSKRRAEPAQATVRFREGDEEVKTVTWRAGMRAPEELSRISVFDSRAAPVYADEESRIEVLPYLLDVLPQLAAVVQALDRRLEVEVRNCDAKLHPALDPAPGAGVAATLLARLQFTAADSSIPRETEIRSAAAWNPASDEELKRIAEDLGTDSVVRAITARAAAKSWLLLADQLSAIGRLLSAAHIQELRSRVVLRDEAKTAAALAAGTTFSNDPLKEVGSSHWRLMFQYAREYSADAYPAEPFPFTGSGSRCVLCQQALSPEATDRLQRFDTFVRDTASAEAARLIAAVETQRGKIELLEIPPRAVLEQVLSPRPELDGNLISGLLAYCDEAEGLRRIVLQVLSSGVGGLPQQGLGPPSEGELRKASALATAEAERLEVLSTDVSKRRALEARQAHLIGAKNLSSRVETLVARGAELEARRTLRALREKCNTRAISVKNTEMRRLFLTREFGERLRLELKALGLEYLPVKVTDRTDGGESFIGVGLETVTPIKDNRAILSEGEFRGLALAAFLAEIAGYDDRHGIVIDDPVSSLDHRHRRQVAERLVEVAGAGRQVVVFTHDLAFFHEVQEAAAASVPQVSVTNHEVRVTAKHGCGTVFSEEEPWIAKKVEDRIKSIRRGLLELSSVPDRTSNEYRKLVKGLSTDIRETWERLVEEVLLNGVVARYQLEVKTQNLKGVVVDDDDHLRVYFEMAKVSRSSGHDRAKGLQQFDVTPEELGREVNALADYVKLLKDRRKATVEAREAKQKAPKGEVI